MTYKHEIIELDGELLYRVWDIEKEAMFREIYGHGWEYRPVFELCPGNNKWALRVPDENGAPVFMMNSQGEWEIIIRDGKRIVFSVSSGDYFYCYLGGEEAVAGWGDMTTSYWSKNGLFDQDGDEELLLGKGRKLTGMTPLGKGEKITGSPIFITHFDEDGCA